MKLRNVIGVGLVIAEAVVFFGVVPREVVRRNNMVTALPPYTVAPATSPWPWGRILTARC